MWRAGWLAAERACSAQADPLHTYMSLAGLSLQAFPSLLPIDPTLNVSLRALASACIRPPPHAAEGACSATASADQALDMRELCKLLAEVLLTHKGTQWGGGKDVSGRGDLPDYNAQTPRRLWLVQEIQRNAARDAAIGELRSTLRTLSHAPTREDFPLRVPTSLT